MYKRQLRQVLINLVGNAIKFTPSGDVDLRVEPIAAQETDDICRLRFVVQDTGPGIASDDLAAIFEPFVQTANGSATPGGTGLGLPISRQFAHLMGGNLTASSAGIPGAGSRFEVVLPLRLVPVTDAPPAQPASTQHAIGLEPGQPDYRLLVAEDHAESQQLLAELLTQLGFAVRTAENGAEAVAAWEKWQPHLIWMDMRMPVMDGHAATRRIKATAQGQQTVIVAVSASVLSDERSAVLAAGCDDFLQKPYREEEIVAQLVKHLGVRFVYAEPSSGNSPNHVEDASDWSAADLPAGWTDRIRQAALIADMERMLRLAAEVDATAPVVARSMRAWIDDFDYDAILRAVDSVHSPEQKSNEIAG